MTRSCLAGCFAPCHMITRRPYIHKAWLRLQLNGRSRSCLRSSQQKFSISICLQFSINQLNTVVWKLIFPGHWVSIYESTNRPHLATETSVGTSPGICEDHDLMFTFTGDCHCAHCEVVELNSKPKRLSFTFVKLRCHWNIQVSS